MKWKIINIVFIAINAALMGAIFAWAFSRQEENDRLSARFIAIHQYSFNLRRYFNDNPKKLDTASFPVREFLDSANIRDANTVGGYLKVLDSIFPNLEQNRELLSFVLTWKLLDYHYNRPIDHLDSLLGIILWVQQFHYAQTSARDDYFFFESLSDFWTNQVAENLSRISEKSPALRYSFEYRYLVQRCAELDYYIPIHVLNYEKFAGNLVTSNWGHLANASYVQSSLWQKSAFVLFMLVFLYGFYVLIYKLVKFGKKLRYEKVNY
jgi:hypothetical protein